jgi:hypothetical protein
MMPNGHIRTTYADAQRRYEIGKRLRAEKLRDFLGDLIFLVEGLRDHMEWPSDRWEMAAVNHHETALGRFFANEQSTRVFLRSSLRLKMEDDAEMSVDIRFMPIGTVEDGLWRVSLFSHDTSIEVTVDDPVSVALFFEHCARAIVKKSKRPSRD